MVASIENLDSYYAEEGDRETLPCRDAARGFYQKYEPKEVLGKGLSSVVRRCILKSTGESFAVKIMDISAELIDEEGLNLRQQTRREADILRKVSGHENIVTLHDVYESNTFIFLVFELCENGELFDYLTNKITLSEKKVRGIMRQILEAVHFCHQLNIVHRDLKPENILLDSSFNVKLTDFGFAKELTSGERLYEICGTPGYLAPELLKAGMLERDECNGYSLEIDAWACGVIMYTLLVGYPPFWHRKQLTMIRLIVEARYSFSSPEWADITEESKDLISRLLVVEPEKRLTIGEALKHKVFRAKDEEGSTHQFNARRTLRVALSAVRFMIRFQRLRFTPEPLSLQQARVSPYAMRMFRKVIDNSAFRVYGHWVKRGEGQNRAAIFEHFPKRELVKSGVSV